MNDQTRNIVEENNPYLTQEEINRLNEQEEIQTTEELTEEEFNKLIADGAETQLVTEEELRKMLAEGQTFDYIIEQTVTRAADPVNLLARELKIDNATSEKVIVENIKKRINENKFDSKEELIKQLTSLRDKGMSDVLSPEATQELLELYDSLNKKEELPLDMENFKQVELKDATLIVSTEQDRILKREDDDIEFIDEFKHYQNEIIANTNDGNVNAKEVFNAMAEYEKEELTMIPIVEAISKETIDLEILNKIKFFITNNKINPHLFKVDINKGIFYNIETSEVLEVRKNTDTMQYEIFKGSEKIYGEKVEVTEEVQIEHEKEEEKLDYDQNEQQLENEEEMTLNRPKVRVLRKDDKPYMGNAAFTKVGFLVINILTFILFTAMIVLLNK